MSEEKRNAEEVKEEVPVTEETSDEAEAAEDIQDTSAEQGNTAQGNAEENQEQDSSDDQGQGAPGEDNEEAGTEEEKTPGDGKGEKKSLFGKKKEKKDKKDQKIEELTDRLQRSMAEFDNFRKRTEKEKASMYVIGAKEVIEKILPVVDNFERGLATMEGKDDAFAEGMRMVYKQLMTTLEDLGVKPIEAVGKEFDPNLHNAVMHVEDEEAGDNEVVEELQKGYLYKDFVVRHSMVKVAN